MAKKLSKAQRETLRKIDESYTSWVVQDHRISTIRRGGERMAGLRQRTLDSLKHYITLEGDIYKLTPAGRAAYDEQSEPRGWGDESMNKTPLAAQKDVEFLGYLITLDAILRTTGWFMKPDLRLRVERAIQTLCDNGYETLVRAILKGYGVDPEQWIVGG